MRFSAPSDESSDVDVDVDVDVELTSSSKLPCARRLTGRASVEPVERHGALGELQSAGRVLIGAL